VVLGRDDKVLAGLVNPTLWDVVETTAFQQQRLAVEDKEQHEEVRKEH
jgi:hypothetical protein